MAPVNQRVFVWGGPAMLLLWLGGFLFFAGFVPPPSPGLSGAEVARIFDSHRNGIRFGLMLTMLGSAFFCPFFALVSLHMKRIEGNHGLLAQTQLVLGALLAIEFIIPMVILQAAAYRPDRPPDTLLAMTDTAWILFISPISTVVLQIVIVGVAILQDARSEPIFPRWSGYASLWVAILITPGAFLVFVTSGPLAWDGLFTWWIPLSVFGVWVLVMTWLVRAANTQQASAAVELATP